MSKSKCKKEFEIEEIVERIRRSEQVERGAELGDFDDYASRRERKVFAPFTERSKLHTLANGASEDDVKQQLKSNLELNNGQYSRTDVNVWNTRLARPSPLNTPPKYLVASPSRTAVFETSQRRDWNMDCVDLEHLVDEDDLYYGNGDFDGFSDNDSLLHYGDFSGDGKDRGHSGCQCFSFSSLFKRRRRK